MWSKKKYKNPTRTLGISFSTKACRQFNLDSSSALHELCQILPIKRIRLMSYWDEIEPIQGQYNFDSLDELITICQRQNIDIMLCLGQRQPRWPETHLPDWAIDLQQSERNVRLFAFIEAVVNRYRDNPNIISYQLENEALNRSFGLHNDYSRQRLRQELLQVKRIDPKKPIIMTTANSWGIPIRRPTPDIYGFSLYLSQFRNNRYNFSRLPIVRLYQIRALIIKIIKNRNVIIHELQMEPWGPISTEQMTLNQQKLSMNDKIAHKLLRIAHRTKISQIDLWGSEWWYWLKIRHQDNSMLDLINRYYSHHEEENSFH